MSAVILSGLFALATIGACLVLVSMVLAGASTRALSITAYIAVALAAVSVVSRIYAS